MPPPLRFCERAKDRQKEEHARTRWRGGSEVLAGSGRWPSRVVRRSQDSGRSLGSREVLPIAMALIASFMPSWGPKLTLRERYPWNSQRGNKGSGLPSHDE